MKVIAMTSLARGLFIGSLLQDDPDSVVRILVRYRAADRRPTVMLTEGLSEQLVFRPVLVDGAQAFAEARPAAATTLSKVATAVGRESTPLAQRSASSQDLNPTQQF
jgi:hypothetical protein